MKFFLLKDTNSLRQSKYKLHNLEALTSTNPNPMKKFKILCVVISSLLLIAASCTKEEPEHQDVVTATINGKPWKAGCKESPPFGCKIGDFQYYTNNGFFELGASNAERDTSFGITLWDIFNPGVFTIRNNQQCGILIKEEPCGRQRHYIKSNDPQEIEIIVIDTVTKIIEGRFHFIGRDTNCLSEPVYVTNGYFKMKYRP